VKLPGRSDTGKVVEAQVRILPTVTDLPIVPPPARLDGESLKPYFDSSENKDRTAFGETDYPLRFGWAPLRSVRAEGFKFIEAPRLELYDLHGDPGELANHYQPSNITVQKFHRMLVDVKTKASPPLAGLPGPEPSLLPHPNDKIEEQNGV